MFYLDVIEKNNKKLNKLSYLYKKFFKLIDIEYVGDKDIKYGTNVDNLNLKIKINMYKINKRSLKKLDKIIDIILENTVCLSNDLKEKLILKYNDLKKYFEIKGINILDSNILFKIMSLKCIDKIVEKCNLNKEELRIGVLVQNINQDILYNLENLINEYKEVVIITNNENYLERLKNKLYLEKGIILDGYPRTETQAKHLDKLLKNIKKYIGAAINIDISEELIIDKKKLILLFNEVLINTQGVNDFILREVVKLKRKDLNNLVNSLPNTNIKIINENEILDYVNKGFLVIISNKIYASEFKSLFDRGVTTIESELSISGPKDSFSENYNLNLALIRKMILNK